ncbi:thioesterase [Polaribacter reichenbachii]|uniref:Thioesterase n=1 Tax=Polaribacter reichenbachii TaxID=996801 RepID=A0A1B8TSC8_9FLAO|nr:thioesterase family protein [Polaribacter reichenbachii]APZ44918.1 thioesterase [Polaribacter reichenbachii]AUC18782.1 thioesterase [Polaribacter reichenbachii]OBY62388.1 thioesterase [Polaribacter reichenbachii]
MEFKVDFTTKWSDFDPNRHMRHTAYNDYAAEVRVRFFAGQNFTLEDFSKHNIGPILFTEETSFRKEIYIGENISANFKVSGLSKDNERWKITHEIFNQAGKLSAIIKVYGAWLDLKTRKLTVPPKEAQHLFLVADKTDDFEEIILKK